MHFAKFYILTIIKLRGLERSEKYKVETKMTRNDIADAFIDQSLLLSSDEEFLFSLCPLRKYTSVKSEHKRQVL